MSIRIVRSVYHKTSMHTRYQSSWNLYGKLTDIEKKYVDQEIDFQLRVCEGPNETKTKKPDFKLISLMHAYNACELKWDSQTELRNTLRPLRYDSIKGSTIRIPGVLQLMAEEKMTAKKAISTLTNDSFVEKELFDSQMTKLAGLLRDSNRQDEADAVEELTWQEKMHWTDLSGQVLRQLKPPKLEMKKIKIEIEAVTPYELVRLQQELSSILSDASAFKLKSGRTKSRLFLRNLPDIVIQRAVCEKVLGDGDFWVFFSVKKRNFLPIKMIQLYYTKSSKDSAVQSIISQIVQKCQLKLLEDLQIPSLLAADLASFTKNHPIHQFCPQKLRTAWKTINEDVQFHGCDLKMKLELTTYLLMRSDDFGFEEKSHSKDLGSGDLLPVAQHVEFNESEKNHGWGQQQSTNSWYQRPLSTGTLKMSQSARLLFTMNRPFSTSTCCPRKGGSSSFISTPTFLKKYRGQRDMYNFKSMLDRDFDEQEFLQGCKMV